MPPFELAQMTLKASPMPAGVTQNIPGQTASLINLSTVLLGIPIFLFFGVLMYFILNSPISSRLWRLRADRAYNKKQYAKAATLYEKLFEFHTFLDGGQTYARLTGECYEHLQRVALAAEWYGKAKDWGRMGDVYQKLGLYKEAIAAYSNGTLKARIALCYEAMGDYMAAGELYDTELQNHHKAKSYYLKALQGVSPGRTSWHKAHLLLCRLALKKGQTNEALTHFKKIQPTIDEHMEKRNDLRQIYETVRFGLESYI